MRLFLAPSRTRMPWPVRALAVVLAVLGPVGLAVSVRAPHGRVASERDTMERVIPLVARAEPSLPVPIAPLAEDTRPRATATPGAAMAPGSAARPGSRLAPRGVPVAGADSSGSAASAASARARVPAARELFRPPTAGAPLCLPPCGEPGRTVAGANGTRAGAGIVFPPLDAARRDSIAQAVVAAAAAKGSAASSPGGSLPPGAVGVSIPVGLPGGGPTRAQRERARALDADVSGRLARLRARADSIAMARRRDSVARAMPHDVAPRDAAPYDAGQRTPG